MATLFTKNALRIIRVPAGWAEPLQLGATFLAEFRTVTIFKVAFGALHLTIPPGDSVALFMFTVSRSRKKRGRLLALMSREPVSRQRSDAESVCIQQSWTPVFTGATPLESSYEFIMDEWLSGVESFLSTIQRRYRSLRPGLSEKRERRSSESTCGSRPVTAGKKRNSL
jgi:hypothetical protein